MSKTLHNINSILYSIIGRIVSRYVLSMITKFIVIVQA
jgi:hypothetical protein